MNYTVFVSKNGNNTTANGSTDKPFATVQAAMEYAYTSLVVPAIAANNFTLRPCVFVNAGTYNDGPLVLPPNICVQGEGYNHTRIQGNWSVDSRWSQAGDFRSMLRDLQQSGGTINLDWNLVSSPTSFFVAEHVRTSGASFVEGNFSQVLLTDCQFFGDVNFTGGLNVLTSCVTFQGQMTLHQNDKTNNYLETDGGALGALVLDAPNTSWPPITANLQHAVQGDQTLTLNGTSINVRASATALPLQPLITLSNGAALTQVARTNQPNFSGPTSERPASPYMGQQFFDSNVGLPIWWNGTAWVDAAGNAV